MAVDHAELVALLLAGTALWQTLTNSDDATEAGGWIHMFEAIDAEDDDITADMLPRAIVFEDSNTSKQAALDLESRTGTLLLAIEMEIPAQYTTNKTRSVWFRDQLMDLRSQMMAISLARTQAPGKSHTHLLVKQMELATPPHPDVDRPIPQDEAPKPVWRAAFRIDW